jgi:hypothetical protein
MPARLGAADLQEFASPRRALLREVAGIEPEPLGIHVLLDKHAGARAAQRLALSDVGGSILVALWPAELKSQAEYLYQEGRAVRMIAAARARSWEIQPTPHLAFFNSHPSQRLYMSPDLSPEEYAVRWEGPDRQMIGRHPPEALETVITPWLERSGLLVETDADAVEQFANVLGRRPVDVRPGLSFKRRWDKSTRGDRNLAKSIRDDVNAILVAAGDPTLAAQRPMAEGSHPSDGH